MRVTAACATLITGILTATAANADIYRHVDSDGTVIYTNVPQDRRYKIYLRVDGENPVTDAFSSSRVHQFGSDKRMRYQTQIQAAAMKNQIDPALIHAVISAESGYDPFARSPAGAAGLMQLMPATAKRFGAQNRMDPAQNIDAGVRYLRVLMNLFDNDLKLALAAYNAGENAVIRAGNRIPPYAETMKYVPRVLNYYKQYRKRM
jgi:soluble lytic murein transglycosylase-like protein